MSGRSRVAFAGLGAIGTPMARHLAGRAELTVWNRTTEKAREFADSNGCKWATTPAEAARSAEFFFTCLPTSREVADVLFASGAAAALPKGALVVDCTSGDPGASREIASRLAEIGVGMIDAPVSGGVAGAEAGALTVMAGGAATDLERARPVLEAFAATIVHCGELGSGEAVKAMNNALLAVHIRAAGEALAALARLGVDPAVALKVINASSGRSFSSMSLFPERVLTRAFPRTFRLALLDKDVRIAASIAHAVGTPSDMIDLASRIFGEARAELGESADHVEVVRVVERLGGVTIG